MSTHTVTVKEILIDLRREAHGRKRRALRWIAQGSLMPEDALLQQARIQAAVELLEDLLNDVRIDTHDREVSVSLEG
jgi:hypothetical protein